MSEPEVTPPAPAPVDPTDEQLAAAVAALGPEPEAAPPHAAPFDAVAYERNVFDKAAELCKKLPEEERLYRGRKYGWRRFSCSAGGPGFPGEYITPDWYGSASLCDPAYFEWVQLEAGLYGGMLNAKGKALLAERAPGDQAGEEAMRKQWAEAEAQIAAEGPEANAQRLQEWREVADGAERDYLTAIADILNIQNPERLSIERLRIVAAVGKPVFASVVSGQDFVVAVAGTPPAPAEEVENIPPEIKGDFNAYMDFVRSNHPIVKIKRKETVRWAAARRAW